MNNPFLKAEWLKEGRGNRLAMLVVFYNALLALVTIMIMLVNSQTFSEGYYYDPATYRYQFLIVSTIQIILSCLIIPFLVWSLFTEDRENHSMEKLMVIPGVPGKFVSARIILVLSVMMLLFVSSLPILLLSAIYSGISWIRIIRLGALIFVTSFWSGSVAIYCFCRRHSGIMAAVRNIFMHALFLVGTLFIIELMYGSFLSSGKAVPGSFPGLALFLLALNPAAVYLGYYVGITGDNSFVSLYCSRLGIDYTSKLFIFLFYKAAVLAAVITAVIFLAGAVRYLNREIGAGKHSKKN